MVTKLEKIRSERMLKQLEFDLKYPNGQKIHSEELTRRAKNIFGDDLVKECYKLNKNYRCESKSFNDVFDINLDGSDNDIQRLPDGIVLELTNGRKLLLDVATYCDDIVGIDFKVFE